jgi:hypothetical protein
VNQISSLLLNRSHNFRMAVASGSHSDAGGEIEKTRYRLRR